MLMRPTPLSLTRDYHGNGGYRLTTTKCRTLQTEIMKGNPLISLKCLRMVYNITISDRNREDAKNLLN